MPKGVPLDDTVRNEIIALRRTEPPPSPADISLELGVGLQTVYRVLRANQLIGDGVGSKVDHLTKQQIGEIIDAYVNDENITEICGDYAISTATLYDLLRAADVPTRSEAQAQQRKQALDDAINMYERGELVYTICRSTGISTYTLNAELHNRGIPLRRARRDRSIPVEPPRIPKRRGE